MDLDEFERVFRDQPRFGPHTIRSPIRYEVWRDFALHPKARLDLLLEAKDSASCVGVAGAVLEGLKGTNVSLSSTRPAISNDVVAVSVDFEQFVRALVPLTDWGVHVQSIAGMEREALARHLRPALRGEPPRPGEADLDLTESDKRTAPLDKIPLDKIEEFRWFALLVARIGRQSLGGTLRSEAPNAILAMAHWLSTRLRGSFVSTARPVSSISVNRIAHSGVNRSRSTIKADAAARVFEIDAATVGWAVIDSGIDATHPAFRRRDPATGLPFYVPFEKTPSRWENRTRVYRTYDLLDVRDRLQVSTIEELNGLDIGARLDKDCQVPADASYRPPVDVHGTHVAGILGANWTHVEIAAADGHQLEWVPNPEPIVGVCPTISLWDFRVLGDDGRGDEFSILTALNHVLRINADAGRLVIQGVNLSLSIPHDVANYACGWTPVCEACDRLVDNGVVVVVSAGNTGFRAGVGRRLADGTSYLSISITDPGNADKVITVGATHRELPYRYGVSYFSSRGPTADGRRKPDVLAPGEGIVAPVGAADRTTLDGTSQAAPHVSGAAALLLARYPELAGQPARVKQILCETASDLGRDSAFQGHGLVDILRALQSI